MEEYNFLSDMNDGEKSFITNSRAMNPILLKCYPMHCLKEWKKALIK